MPFKHNTARPHRIPRARYRVMNWPANEAGLWRRGDLTLWLDEAALAGWVAPKRSSPGRQPLFSELAIELVLTLPWSNGQAEGQINQLKLTIPRYGGHLV